MSQIGENKIGEFELNITLIRIENIIRILSSFEGKIFGEYVREVIIPRIQNPTCDVIFNCIDIWFKNQMKADDFVKFVQVNIDEYFHEETHLSENIDLRGSKYYKCCIFGDIPVKFNIVVDSSFPIYDFDVNSLTYFYPNCNPIVENNSPILGNKKEQIIEAIHKKEASMMKSYFINMVNNYLTYPQRVKIINELYEARGWTIMCEGVKITSPFIGTTDDAIAKEKFVNRTLLERSREESRENREIKLMRDIMKKEEKKEIADDSKQDIIEKKEISNDFKWSPERAEWTSDNLDEQKRIFNLEFRITGTPSNISTSLKECGYLNYQIEEAIENSITKDNYESTKKTEYLEEIERHKKSKLNSLETKKEKLNQLDKNDSQEIPNKKEQAIYVPEYRLMGSQADILNTLKFCGCSDDKIKTEDFTELNLKNDDPAERRVQLINNFISSDKLFKAAIINRNKAFFKCISDFEITDKLYIFNRIIEYSEELSSKIIIEELSTKK